MTGRKALVGLSLLCALVFSAFAASSASAEGTTAFTCEPVASEAQFSDAHCTTPQAGGKGFRHTPITQDAVTEVTGTNEKTAGSTTAATAAVLHGVLSTIPVTITCNVVHTTGTLTNKAGPPMFATGPAATEYSECTTIIEGTKTNCKVKEPIVANSTITTVVEGGEMYVKATGSGAGELFVSLTFGNNGLEVCPKGITSLNPYKVTGAAIGTPKGATLEFKEKEAHSTLKLGGNPAEITQIETLQMVEGNAITVTTTES
jgi:hypothetical protein